MVFAEAFAVGVPASAAGCVLGGYGAPWLARTLVRQRVAPGWFAIGGAAWPYGAAFGTGLLVVMAGVWAAGRRAGRVAPTEALRDAALDHRVMAPGRLVAGGALLLGGGWLLVSGLVSDPGGALHRKAYTVQPMVLITAVALLAPAVVRPLVRLLAWLPARLPGATWMLAGESAAAAVRRSAALAAPVLMSVALAGSLLGAAATVDAAKAAEARGQSAAGFVVTAADGAGFAPATVARVAAVPGADTAAFAPSTVHTLEDGVALVADRAEAVSRRGWRRWRVRPSSRAGWRRSTTARSSSTRSGPTTRWVTACGCGWATARAGRCGSRRCCGRAPATTACTSRPRTVRAPLCGGSTCGCGPARTAPPS